MEKASTNIEWAKLYPSSLYIFTETTPLFRKCVKFQAGIFSLQKVLWTYRGPVDRSEKPFQKRFQQIQKDSTFWDWCLQWERFLAWETMSWVQCVSFLDIILSMRVYLQHPAYLSLPLCGTLTGPTTSRFCVARVFFSSKNLKGRVSERNVAKHWKVCFKSLSSPFAFFSQPFQIFAKKSSQQLFHTNRLTWLSTIPTAWERSRTPMRLRTMNVMRTIYS